MSTNKAHNVPPFTVAQVIELFDDLSTEMYYGDNMKHAMMESSDEFMHSLHDFVREVHIQRVGIFEAAVESNGPTDS